MNTFFNVSTCKSKKKKTTLILSTDPGALTFEQWIALASALLWFSTGFRSQKQMHIGKILPVYWPLSLIFIIYLIFIYLFIYLFLSLLSSSTVSKKVWSYHFFSQLPFNCFAASSYYTDQSALGGEERGEHPRAKVSEKVVREFFSSLFNLMVILFIFFVCLFFFLRIETGHEVLDELIGRCCGELSIIIYGDVLHGLSRIKTIINLVPRALFPGKSALGTRLDNNRSWPHMLYNEQQCKHGVSKDSSIEKVIQKVCNY